MNPKRIAAQTAVGEITSGMIVGLGTGSTASFAIEEIGERVRQGLFIQAVPTSLRSEQLARELSIPIHPVNESVAIDITLDGADQVDAQNNLIKGGGGSLLREKIVAFNSRRFCVIVDGSKLVNSLTFPLPIEIIPFGSAMTLGHVRSLGCSPAIRQYDGQDFITDNGNLVADCHFSEPIADPERLSAMLKKIPGVVETGLFPSKMVSTVFVGYANGDVNVFQGNK